MNDGSNVIAINSEPCLKAFTELYAVGDYALHIKWDKVFEDWPDVHGIYVSKDIVETSFHTAYTFQCGWIRTWDVESLALWKPELAMRKLIGPFGMNEKDMEVDENDYNSSGSIMVGPWERRTMKVNARPSARKSKTRKSRTR